MQTQNHEEFEQLLVAITPVYNSNNDWGLYVPKISHS